MSNGAANSPRAAQDAGIDQPACMNPFPSRTNARRTWRLLLSAAALCRLILGCGVVVIAACSGSNSGNPPAAGTGGSSPAVLESQLSNDPTFASGEPWVATDPLNSQIVLATWTTVVDF